MFQDLLKLVELALLQANAQTDQMLGGRRANARPLLRDIVGVLDGIGVTTEERSTGHGVCSEEDCEQGGGSEDLHGDVSKE